MKPSARLQTVIDLFGQWEAEKPAADVLLQQHFRTSRYIGSKDRREITERFYHLLRHYAPLRWQAEKAGLPPRPRALALAAVCFGGDHAEPLFDGSPYGPPPLSDQERKAALAWHGQPLLHPAMPDDVRHNLPKWLYDKIAGQYKEKTPSLLEALAKEAPTDLRCNTLKTNRERLRRTLAGEGILAEPTPHSPLGLRLPARNPKLTQTEAFRRGWFEIQDEASQLVAQIVNAHPEQTVLDYCAGGGGKTLAIAAQMQNRGRLIASDINFSRMENIKKRAERAGVTCIQTTTTGSDHLLPLYKEKCDRVLVDAPLLRQRNLEAKSGAPLALYGGATPGFAKPPAGCTDGS